MAGIQLVGVVLANKLAPFKPNTAVDKDRLVMYILISLTNTCYELINDNVCNNSITNLSNWHCRFYKYLAMNMQNSAKEVHQSSAEVVGMAVKYLADTEKTVEGREWRDGYIDNISKMLLGLQGAKPDQFINCVYKMQIHYKPLGDRCGFDINISVQVQEFYGNNY